MPADRTEQVVEAMEAETILARGVYVVQWEPDAPRAFASWDGRVWYVDNGGYFSRTPQGMGGVLGWSQPPTPNGPAFIGPRVNEADLVCRGDLVLAARPVKP